MSTSRPCWTLAGASGFRIRRKQEERDFPPLFQVTSILESVDPRDNDRNGRQVARHRREQVLRHGLDRLPFPPATITTLDADHAGIYTSVALGSEGLGLIAYLQNTPSTTPLKVAHCDNVQCTTALLTPLDTGWFSGVHLAIGADGIGLVSC